MSWMKVNDTILLFPVVTGAKLVFVQHIRIFSGHEMQRIFYRSPLNCAIRSLCGVIQRRPRSDGYRWPVPHARLQDNRILAAIWQPRSVDKWLIVVHEDVCHLCCERAKNLRAEHKLTDEAHWLPCLPAQRPLWRIYPHRLAAKFADGFGD